MLQKVFHTSAAFESLSPAWDALLATSVTNTPFQTSAFLQVWWRHFGNGQLHLLAYYQPDTQQLLGLAPLFVDEQRILRWVGGEEIADYLDVIAAPAHVGEVRQAMFAYLQEITPQWDFARLANIPGWSESKSHLQALAQQVGWHSALTQQDVCPLIALPASYEDYLQQLDSKQRREVQRKQRRAEAEEGLHFHILAPDEDISAATDQFLALMRASQPEKAVFLQRPNMLNAFTDLLATFHARGWLQLAFLSLEGQALAAYFNFNYAGKVWVYNSGLDPQTAAALSPGWVLLANLIEHAILNGASHFDFLQGDEDYKYRFGGKNETVWLLELSNQSTISLSRTLNQI